MRDSIKMRRRPGTGTGVFATIRLLFLLLGSWLSAGSQTSASTASLPAKPAPGLDFRSTGRANFFLTPYKAPPVRASSIENSNLISSLLQDGKLPLTLEDAVTLAIEKNFDVELQRYDSAFAETEILRAKGGGELRGIPTTVGELPSGEGGPGEPLLTAIGGYTPVLQLPSSAADLATITGTQSDLSVLGASPFSHGSSIPRFDPSIDANVALAQTSYPQATAFSTGSNFYSSHSLLAGAGYTQGFSPGTLLNVGVVSNRLREASTRLNLNPFTTGALSLSVTQPLLQGFGVSVNRRFIHIAHNEDAIAQNLFTQQLIATVSDAIRLYWDLVSLQQDLHVKQESLTAAERLYEDTKDGVDLGTQAPLDLTSAQAQVYSNRQALINARGMVLQQELLLKEVLTRKGISEPALAEASIEAITPIPQPESDPLEPLGTLLHEAMQQRPDLALAERQEDSARSALKGSRNAILPQLNLVASMQNNAGAGTLSPNLAATPGNISDVPPASLIGGYGSMLKQIFSRDFPDYTVGAQLNIPLRNRVARADAARDELQYRQSEVRVQQLHSQVRLQVGNAYIALQQAKESYAAAVQARTLQEQALDVAKAKFQAGVATAYDLLQYQSTLAQARSAEVTALGVYAKSRNALQRATGATLVVRNISVSGKRNP